MLQIVLVVGSANLWEVLHSVDSSYGNSLSFQNRQCDLKIPVSEWDSNLLALDFGLTGNRKASVGVSKFLMLCLVWEMKKFIDPNWNKWFRG